MLDTEDSTIAINAGQNFRFVPSPTYEKIKADLLGQIVSGHWAVGTLIPSRRQLAGKYQVDLRTLQRAITSLLDDGVLKAEGTRGTYVARMPTSDTARRTVTAPPQPGPSGPTGALVGLIGLYHPDVLGSTGAVPRAYDAEGSGFPAHQDDFISPILQALELQLHQGGHATAFSAVSTDGASPSVEAALAGLLEKGCDALVVVDLHYDPVSRAALDRLPQPFPVPLVYVSDSRATHYPLHVYYYNRGGGYVAAQHLLHQGHRRLLFLAGVTHDWAEARLAGAQEAVARNGAPAEVRRWPDLAQCPCMFGEQESYAANYAAAQAAIEAGLIGQQTGRPQGTYTGIIAANDNAANAFLQAASEAGLRPRADFAIMGFDDAPASRPRGLTSMRRPLIAMGQEAANLVKRALVEPHLNMEVRLRMNVVPRASTLVEFPLG